MSNVTPPNDSHSWTKNAEKSVVVQVYNVSSHCWILVWRVHNDMQCSAFTGHKRSFFKTNFWLYDSHLYCPNDIASVTGVCNWGRVLLRSQHVQPKYYTWVPAGPEVTSHSGFWSWRNAIEASACVWACAIESSCFIQSLTWKRRHGFLQL